MSEIMENTQLVTLAIITSVHGVRGEVKVKPYTEYPEDITAYGTLVGEDGNTPYPLTITGSAKGQLIAHIDGITDRNTAEKLRGVKLCVPRNALPEADEEDAFYIEDLNGLNVQLSDGSPYGTIKAVHNFGAGDLIEIMPANAKKSEYFAFDEKTFPTLDLNARTATLCPPELINASAEAAAKEMEGE